MTAPATPPDWDAIARFLSGESPAEEASVVREWLDANPRDRELVQRLDASASTDAPADVDVEAALARVHARMAEPAPAGPRLTMARGGASPRSRQFVFVTAIAAAAAAVFVTTMRHPSHISEPAPAGFHTYATGVGQRDSVLLPDSSRVTLGPQSKLTVPDDYGKSSRAVALTGDAYFTVRHNAAKPFTVRAAQAVIEDIGTTFTVESDAGVMTSVAVITGSVRLRTDHSAPTAGIVLSAGDRGSIDADGNTRLEHNAVREEDVAWTTGRLVFNDAPLSRVIAEIQRWYGVSIRVTDSTMLAKKVHMSFDGEPIDRVLEIVGLTLSAKIERHGDTATVSPTRGPAVSR